MLGKVSSRLILSIVASILLVAAGLFFLSPATPAQTSQDQAANNNPSLVSVATLAPSTSLGTSTQSSNFNKVGAVLPSPQATASSGPVLVKGGKPDAAQPVYLPQHLQLAGIPTTVYVPQHLSPNQSVQLLVALHGMHGDGGTFCQGLVAFSEQNHVILLAPTFDYNLDYKNPQVVSAEDVRLTTKLNQMVKELGNGSHLQLKNRVLLYGFSRGAQLAHHYAMFYPKQTLGVTVFSGGAYTLPFLSMVGKTNQSLPFPLGVSDFSEYANGQRFDEASFAKIKFNIEVGGNDNDPTQVSRAWDQVLGTNRLDRAKNYYQALQQLKMTVQFNVFPGANHEVSIAMNQAALSFMQGLLSSQVTA